MTDRPPTAGRALAVHDRRARQAKQQPEDDAAGIDIADLYAFVPPEFRETLLDSLGGFRDPDMDDESSPASSCSPSWIRALASSVNHMIRVLNSPRRRRRPETERELRELTRLLEHLKPMVMDNPAEPLEKGKER